MKPLALSLVAAVAFMGGLRSTASAYDHFTSGMAQDVYASTTQLPLVAINDCSGYAGCDSCDDCCDSCGGAIVFDVELAFLKFGEEGGVRDSGSAPGSFDYEIAPRLMFGYVRDDGFGVRTRFWWFDHSTVSAAANPIDVDTYVVDAEFFQIVDLCNGTSLDIAGGVRYTDFNILLGAGVQGHFDGYGLTTALNLRKDVLSGNVYAKTRLSLLTGDIQNRLPGVVTGFDHPVTQIELGVGYEAARYLDSGAVLRFRAGLENQQWLSIVPRDVVNGFFGDDDEIDDISFFGFVAGVGIDY